MAARRAAMAVSAEMRHRLLVEFNGRPVAYPRDRTVGDMISERAAAHPDRVAVVYGTGRLTYGRLDGAANRLAAQLADAGVRKGDLVPMYLEGGPELPVAVLALLKLGAPFVPLDPGWPRRRTAAALAALAPRAVVYAPEAEPPLPAAAAGARLVRASLDALPSAPEPPAGPPITADDVAYGFYTSGSTGAPKCALNPHVGLINRVHYMSRTHAADGGVVLQNSRVSFDSSLWQLLWPLTAGNRVVLRAPTGTLDLASVVATIAEHGVTMTDFVPSVFDALVELAEADPSVRAGLRSLRRLYLGGEQVNARAVHRFQAMLPDVACTNTYGPTECSIGSVFHEISPADGDSVPIGRPIDNTYAVVLDAGGRLVAPGVVGEIHLGGDCLGRGYLGDVAKTRRAFVPNAFPEVPGPLLYRTGDLGSQREDGLLQFVGRADQQVKVGGVRLELTEVETALAAFPAVRVARVLVLDDGGERRLVGFVVPTAGAAVDVEQLRAHAARSLLPAAVPARLVLLDALPLNPNGKVDRQALAKLAAAPEQWHPAGRTEDLTAEQAAVTALWEELLGVPAVGLDADFGTLGGTSLTAQRLALRLLTLFDVRLSPRDLIRAATVRDQAALLSGGAGDPAAGGPSTAQLRLDVRLDPEIVGGPARRPGPPRQVLLTGATGFIGTHLLRELVERTGARVVCLVRGTDDDDARARLVAAATGLGTWDSTVAARTEVIAGDLALPRLGLTPARFVALGRRLDAIVHCGAQVNLMLGYRALRAANVLGTGEVLRLAATGPTTPVLALSTLSVVRVSDRLEGAPPIEKDQAGGQSPRLPDDGYSQSKWVAERLLALAASRGIPVAVYRLGEVTAHSVTGVSNPLGLLDNLLSVCVRLGLRPAIHAATDWTPVDAIARVLVAGLLAGPPKDAVVQLFDPRGMAVDRVLDALAVETRLTPVSYLDFWTALRDEVVRTGDEALTRLLAVLPAGPAPEAGFAALFTDSGRHYAAGRSQRLLDGLNLRWPRVDEPMLRRYARQLVAGSAAVMGTA
jgi:amino acid adenylation domain-containing protein/thioester reductase-like protein